MEIPKESGPKKPLIDWAKIKEEDYARSIWQRKLAWFEIRKSPYSINLVDGKKVTIPREEKNEIILNDDELDELSDTVKSVV